MYLQYFHSSLWEIQESFFDLFKNEDHLRFIFIFIAFQISGIINLLYHSWISI